MSYLQSRSSDGGLSWGPTTVQWDLVSPLGGCEASLIAHPNGKLYLAQPTANGYPQLRYNLTVKVL
jgi:hypothetical protein